MSPIPMCLAPSSPLTRSPLRTCSPVVHHSHCQPGSVALAVGRPVRQPGRISTAVEQHRLNSNAITARVKVGGSRSQFLVLASASTAQMEPQGGAAARATSSLPAGATEDDAVFMRRAVELAQTAIGKTAPNPIVGCVIVKDGKIVGEGFHPKAGEPHAEVFALRMAGPLAEGATAYVTLEPCNHFGRTPPCSQALVKAKVAKVVVGTVDPNPLVGGKGIKTLNDAGIATLVGVEQAACQRNVEAFMFRIVNQRPFATLRYSMALDGRLLAYPGSTEQGSHYSKLLEENDAVIVTDAALVDNPQLTLLSAEPGCKQPLRVILALSLADLDASSPVFDTSQGPVLVVTGEAALAEDNQRASTTGTPAAETWLREKGVELIVTQGEGVGGGSDWPSPGQVLDLCYQRGACAVVWDCQGPPGSGLEGFLGRWALEEGLVEKVVVSMPFVMGGKGALLGGPGGGEGFFSGVEKGREVSRVVATNYKSEVVLEGYFFE